MPIITEKEKTLNLLNRCRENGVSMATLGTASHWNTESDLAGVPSDSAEDTILRACRLRFP
jgi:hypothetical protein